MGSIFKPKTKNVTSTQTSEPWKPAQEYLKNILDESSEQYEAQKEAGYISPTGDLSKLYAPYMEGLSQVGRDAPGAIQGLLGQSGGLTTGAADVYGQAQRGELAITPEQIAAGAGQFMNEDLLQQQIEAAQRPTVRQFTEQALPSIDRSAVASGGAGSSRAGIAAGVAQRGAEESMRDISARMRGQAYESALGRSQSQLAQNLSTRMGGAGAGSQLGGQLFSQAGMMPQVQMGAYAPQLQRAQMGQMLQGANQADLMGQRDYIMNLLQRQYAPLVGGIGGMGGTSTGSQPMTGASPLQSMTGMMGGAGQMMGGISSMMNMFSDERLKENIKFIGTYKGHNIYGWDWKEGTEVLVG